MDFHIKRDTTGDLEPVAIERPVYCELCGYAGTLALYAKVITPVTASATAVSTCTRARQVDELDTDSKGPCPLFLFDLFQRLDDVGASEDMASQDRKPSALDTDLVASWIRIELF